MNLPGDGGAFLVGLLRLCGMKQKQFVELNAIRLRKSLQILIMYSRDFRLEITSFDICVSNMEFIF